NNRILDNVQTLAAGTTGSAAGILGLTGWAGFAFYVVSWLVSVATIHTLKTGSSPSRYFPAASALATQTLVSSLFTFVLFWTLAFGLVHVYD
ncbi:Rab5-interacting protein family, partial [Dimargaris cristalligena]